MRTIIFKITLCLFLALFSTQISQAQFGKLKDKLKKKKKPVKKETTTTSKPSTTTTSTTKAEPAKVELKPLTFERFQPRLSYSTLLRSISIQEKTGKFYINNVAGLTVSFLPKTEEGGGKAVYGPEANQHKIEAFLKEGDKQLAKFVFRIGREEGPYTEISGVSSGSVTATKAGYVGSYTFTNNANCVLEFTIDGKLFQKFPFKVEKKENSDAYAKYPHMFFLEGPWSDFGYINIPDNKDDSSVYFKFYSRHQNLEYVSKDYFYAIKMYKDGKIFAINPVSSGFDAYKPIADMVDAKRIWKRYEKPLFKAANTNKLIFGRDLRQDGNYEVRVMYYEDSKPGSKQIAGPWGQKMDVYAFQIKGGKIVHQGRQDRATKDNEFFIEGGRDAWWIQKKGGTYLK